MIGMQPSELIHKVKRSREMRRFHVQVSEQRSTEGEMPLAPPMPTNHANYSRLMRSHDRMGSRHLSKREI